MLDLLIEGGELVDGTGAARRPADVAVKGDRVAAIGRPGEFSACRAGHRIDARGHVVAPGFVDCHTHDDQLLLEHPRLHPKLLQGVTTVVTGNCGISLAPLVHAAPPAPLDALRGDFRFATMAEYVAAVEQGAPAVNAVLLVGHSTLRVGAVSDLSRPATPAECERMRRALHEALDAGAIGLSTGVFYPPARAADAAELVAVAQPLAGGCGLVAMHLRDEGAAIDAAIDEALVVGRRLGSPLVLSHHKLLGRAQHGGSARTLAAIAAASRDVPVCIDCYPYTASSTMLMPERVAGCTDVQITWSQAEPSAAGRSLRAMAAERGVAPEVLAAKLLPAGAVYFAMSDEDVDRILAHPLSMIGSDGLPGDAVPHPRLWGSFPRVLGLYVRDRRLLSLEAAVHKMTGLPARRFGLVGRGELRTGSHADITVFDPARIADRADYAQPRRAPEGIGWVLLNGRIAVQPGPAGAEVVERHAGRLLKRGAGAWGDVGQRLLEPSRP